MAGIYVGDNKNFVWQWQPKEQIVLEGYPEGVYVHYANCDTVEAPVVQSRMEGDKLVADIPPELMQVDKDITVYVCDTDGTKHCHFLSVLSRPKPESYVTEPVEVLRYESLAELFNLLENRVGKELGDKLDADRLPDAVSAALAQAKESGEFDGPPGDDYVLTDADRQEIAEIAAGLVEVPNVKPVAKTEDMTQPVGVDDEGRLWSAPTAGGSGGGTIEWEVLTDIELAEESAISPISYDAKKFSAVHARLIIPKVSEKIALTNNFWFLHAYGLYWTNVGDINYPVCVDLRCEIMGAYMMEIFSNRPMNGVGNHANLQTRSNPMDTPIEFRCGGTAVFPAGTKLTVWGRM